MSAIVFKEFTTGAVFLNFLTCLVAIRHHWVGIQGMNTHVIEWSCIIRYIYLTSCILKTCQSVECPPNCWGCDSVILHHIDCTHFNFRDLNHPDFSLIFCLFLIQFISLFNGNHLSAACVATEASPNDFFNLLYAYQVWVHWKNFLGQFYSTFSMLCSI